MADIDKSLYSLRYNQINSTLEAFGGGSPQWTQVTLNNVDPTQVPVTRQINTTAPLQGGGNLTADRTLSIPQATSGADGYLLAADWTTFNSKLTSLLNSANIFVGNGSNVAVGVALSGDASLSNAGALTFNTVNGNVGTFMNAMITVNAKGLITAASSGTIGNLTDAGTDGIVVTGGVGAVLGTGTSIAQHVADATHNGYLSSTDWSRFNSDTAGITALTGDVTATGPGSVAATLATVNASPGTTTISTVTTNAKGLVTANSSASTTGSGNVVLATSPTLVTPLLGTPTSGVLTNCTGTAAGLTAGTVTTNANLTGVITSSGNATSIASQTGTGTKFVVDTSPTLVTPTIGAATATSLTFSPTTGGIVGTTTNDNAGAGKVGEYIANSASVSITTAGYTTIASVALTAGDWDISFVIFASANTAGIEISATIATATNTNTGMVNGDNAVGFPFSATFDGSGSVANWRASLAGNQSYFLTAKSFGANTTCAGRISARRIR